MNFDGFFWYSVEQRHRICRFSYTHRNYCNIGGKIQEYTQWMSGKYLRKPSNFKDAVCLGYGFVVFNQRTPWQTMKDFWVNLATCQ